MSFKKMNEIPLGERTQECLNVCICHKKMIHDATFVVL